MVNTGHCNHGAHGVVVSHPLSMREALGSIPSVSISEDLYGVRITPASVCGMKHDSWHACLQVIANACPSPLLRIFLYTTSGCVVVNTTFKGTWCSGITPAQHAGGPGFNPQRVHVLEAVTSKTCAGLKPRMWQQGGSARQDASAGNRTRVTSMATMYSTTRPLMQMQQDVQ